MGFFDVVIIGAGPAGLKCAETLGGSGLTVLVLEKNSSVGRKVCAGGLTSRCLEYLAPPSSILERFFDSVVIHRERKDFRVRGDKPLVAMVDRNALGEWQLSRSARFRNVEIRFNAAVSAVEKECVHVGEKRVAYRFLVGADGSSSIVRKFLGIPSRKVCVGIQYTLPGSSFQDLELFCSPDLFSAWYAWIFPHKRSVVVGCVCDPRYLPAKALRENFHRWLSLRGIDASHAVLEAAPLNYDYQGIRFGNVFLVGDAGGFVFGLTGEGIYSALVSGEEAARSILDSKYVSIKTSKLLALKNKQERALDFLIKSGDFRRVAYALGFAAARVPSLRERALRLFVGAVSAVRPKS